MSGYSITLTFAAGVLLASSPAALTAQAVPATQQQQIEAAVKALHVELRAAAGKLDAEALYAHVLDTETPPIIENGVLQPTRAAALANTAAGFRALTGVSYTYAHEHVTALSPTVALWVADGTGTITLPDGRELAAPFAETVLLVRRDGQWHVLHAHRSTPNQP